MGGAHAARRSRGGLGAIAAELHTRPDGLVHLSRRRQAAELPPPRLLGAFDPVLLGWSSREAILGSREVIVVANGMFRPFALVRGRAVATWSMPGGEAVLKPFARLTGKDAAALRVGAEDVVRYLGTNM